MGQKRAKKADLKKEPWVKRGKLPQECGNDDSMLRPPGAKRKNWLVGGAALEVKRRNPFENLHHLIN